MHREETASLLWTFWHISYVRKWPSSLFHLPWASLSLCYNQINLNFSHFFQVFGCIPVSSAYASNVNGLMAPVLSPGIEKCAIPDTRPEALKETNVPLPTFRPNQGGNGSSLHEHVYTYEGRDASIYRHICLSGWKAATKGFSLLQQMVTMPQAMRESGQQLLLPKQRGIRWWSLPSSRISMHMRQYWWGWGKERVVYFLYMSLEHYMLFISETWHTVRVLANQRKGELIRRQLREKRRQTYSDEKNKMR